MKKPSIQFYPGDWRKDPAIACLSLAARGLWFEMLMLMHESPRRGYLVMTHDQLARAVGATPREVRLRLGELQLSNTVSFDNEGVMFNRRMVREEEISTSRSKAGASGAHKRWVLPSVCHDVADGKIQDLPLPLEGEVEVESEIEETPETGIVEIFAALDVLYTAAGLPIPPKHKKYCLQILISIPPEKRRRVPGYVKHMLDTGRWSSVAKTKGLKNLLIDGDWDVPIVERTVGSKSTIESRRLADADREKEVFERDYASWESQNCGHTRDEFVDWRLSEAEKINRKAVTA